MDKLISGLNDIDRGGLGGGDVKRLPVTPAVFYFIDSAIFLSTQFPYLVNLELNRLGKLVLKLGT